MNSTQLQKARILEILKLLEKAYPNSRISLNYQNPYELLIATVLSAQTTDSKVNEVTPQLFKRYPTPKHLAEATVEEIAEMIRPVNFHNNKARFLKHIAETIMTRHQGKVPDTMEALIRLKGVARKTANVVLWNGFGKSEGIAVDTHVKRIAPRLGLTKSKNPIQIEKDLMTITPKHYWGKLTHLFIDHGRKICKPRKPRCKECILRQLCPSAKTFLLNQTTSTKPKTAKK